MRSDKGAMISIQDQQTRLPYLARSLRRRIHKLLRALSFEHVEISTVLCDDPAIRELNLTWRGIDRPTDVLSFPLEEFASPLPLEVSLASDVSKENEGEDEALDGLSLALGDIVISTDTCVVQAKEQGHSPLDEATRLWVHGLLHLCGYDHESPEDAAVMRKKEEEILQIFQQNVITPLVSLE